jgi:threonine dehydratase
VPDPEALAIILKGAARVVTVSDAEIRHAARAMFDDTRNPAEGAGSAPLAAALQERARLTGKRVALIQSGGNIERALLAELLSETDAE